jgi:hypothetical protein
MDGGMVLKARLCGVDNRKIRISCQETYHTAHHAPCKEIHYYDSGAIMVGLQQISVQDSYRI